MDAASDLETRAFPHKNALYIYSAQHSAPCCSREG
jgi:hypothetical protein